MKAIVVKEFGDPRSALRGSSRSEARAGASGGSHPRTGVNPVDTYIRAGVYPRKPALPYTPGSDGAGVVLSVGKDVTRSEARRPGLSGGKPDRHLCRAGALRGMVCFPAARALSPSRRGPRCTSLRHGIPRSVRSREGAAAETVLIHGASGGVGIAAVQLARAAGLRVVGTAGTERGLKAHPRRRRARCHRP